MCGCVCDKTSINISFVAFIFWLFLNIFLIQVFQTIIFIFIVISTAFRLMCPSAFFRCFLSNLGSYTELRTTSFILIFTCSDSVNHNWVQVLCISVLLLQLTFDKKRLKKGGGYIGRNVMNITIKMKSIARKPWMIKIIKLQFRNSNNLCS